jgi:hypothetical protein
MNPSLWLFSELVLFALILLYISGRVNTLFGQGICVATFLLAGCVAYYEYFSFIKLLWSLI